MKLYTNPLIQIVFPREHDLKSKLALTTTTAFGVDSQIPGDRITKIGINT